MGQPYHTKCCEHKSKKVLVPLLYKKTDERKLCGHTTKINCCLLSPVKDHMGIKLQEHGLTRQDL